MKLSNNLKWLLDNLDIQYLFKVIFKFFIDQKIDKTSPWDSIPQKELHKILDKDIKRIVQDFTEKANDAKLAHVTNEKDLNNYNPINYEESARNLRILVNAAINTYD